MHPPEVCAKALEAGVNDCEISRRLGIPRRTILDWRRPSYVSRRTIPLGTCPRCWRAAKPMRFTADDSAELLGLYLGDGSISKHPRAHRLRIALDAKYPVIIEESCHLLARCFPENAVDVVTKGLKGKLVNVSIYSQHLVCLFPPHGMGKKHERDIILEAWQQEIIASAPWPFIRGCIRTDGSAFINRTDIHRPEPYEYLSYDFSNMSKGITDLFVMACDQVGVFTRKPESQGALESSDQPTCSVALMLEHVGIKA